MKRILVLFIMSLILSCNKEDYKKVDAKSIADNELKTIDLSQVDRYPLFESCDETATKLAQQQCFEKNLHGWLKPYLDTLSVKQLKADTITLFLTVSEKGQLTQDSMVSSTAAGDKIKEIFKSSPILYPPLKQGVPVKVSFQMPLIIHPKAIY